MSENKDSKVKNNAARPPSFWRRVGMQFGIWSVGIFMWLIFVVTASSLHLKRYLPSICIQYPTLCINGDSINIDCYHWRD